MNNAFFQKRLQGTIYGNPVEFFPGLPLNIAMRKGPVAHQEQLQDPFAATGYTQLIFLKYFVYLRFHCKIIKHRQS